MDLSFRSKGYVARHIMLLIALPLNYARFVQLTHIKSKQVCWKHNYFSKRMLFTLILN